MSQEPSVERVSRRDQIEATFPVVHQLRPHLAAASYVETVERMFRSGFEMAVVRVAGQVTAVTGFHYGESLAWGPYLYVDDLVTSDTDRSRGHGKLLLDWLKSEARSHGCAELHLDSGVQRHGAHRFYLRERMDIVAYHFKIIP